MSAMMARHHVKAGVLPQHPPQLSG